MSYMNFGGSGGNSSMNSSADYHAYKSTSVKGRSGSGNYSGNNSGGSSILSAIGVIVIIVFVGILITSCNSSCEISGCDNDKQIGSEYCHAHNFSILEFNVKNIKSKPRWE